MSFRVEGRFGECDVPAECTQGVCGDWDKMMAWGGGGTLWSSSLLPFPLPAVAVRSVACGERILCCVDAGGVLLAARFGQTTLARVADGVERVFCGTEHALALLNTGYAASFGGNTFGQCGTGTVCEESAWKVLECGEVRDVACGALHSVLVTTEGQALFAGWCGYGQDGGRPGDMADPRVAMWTPIRATEPIVSAACGLFHTLLLSKAGRVTALGYDCDGQLGISGLEDIAQVAAGRRHSVAVSTTGHAQVVGFFRGAKTAKGVNSAVAFGWTTVFQT